MVESDVKHLGQIADEPPRRKPANSPPKFPLLKNPTPPIHHYDLLLHLRPTAKLPLLISLISVNQFVVLCFSFCNMRLAQFCSLYRRGSWFGVVWSAVALPHTGNLGAIFPRLIGKPKKRLNNFFCARCFSKACSLVRPQ